MDGLLGLWRLLARRVLQVRLKYADLSRLRFFAILLARPEQARLVVVALFAIDQFLEPTVDYLLLVLFRFHPIGVQLIIVCALCFVEFGAGS